jgi:hypothetical protein
MKRERERATRAKAMGMRVAGNEEGKGNKGVAMATRIASEWTGATATKRAMVTATRVAGSNGNHNGYKEDAGNGNNGGGQQRGQWRW